MITDFEEITQPLDKEEKKIAMMIGRYICRFSRQGKESSNNFLRLYLHQNGTHMVKPIRVRAMIHWLRVKHKFKYILANGRGYYYSRSKKDLERYQISLSNRVNAIMRVYHSFDQKNVLPNFNPVVPGFEKPRKGVVGIKRKSYKALYTTLSEATNEVLDKNITGEAIIPDKLAKKLESAATKTKKKKNVSRSK